MALSKDSVHSQHISSAALVDVVTGAGVVGFDVVGLDVCGADVVGNEVVGYAVLVVVVGVGNKVAVVLQSVVILLAICAHNASH